jgi:predicted transcriptional regulator of viral defense system
MIKTTSILKQELEQYSDITSRISILVAKGELIPIVRGYYETDRSILGHYLASIIYGPSYLSFEFALSYYGLIPEAVYHFTSATFNKRRRKNCETPFGFFTYRDVPKMAFNLSVLLFKENGYSFFIASPEKAICDMLYTFEPCANQKELSKLLFNFLRLDREEFSKLNIQLLIELTHYYQTKNLKLLRNYLRKEQENANNTKSND